MIIRLPWPPNELSPNWTGKLRKKIRAKKQYKDLCGWELIGQGVKALTFKPDQIFIRYTFLPPGKYAYDKDNLQARMKYAQDMIAQRLGVDDRIFEPLRPIIEKSQGKPGYVLVEIKETEE